MLIDTYLDGAGIFAWRPSATGDGYVPVPLPGGERVTALDDVLHRIESEISNRLDDDGNPPPPVEPEQTALNQDQLPEDPDRS